MNTQIPQSIFDAEAHAGVMQDKYPPTRIKAASVEPVTASTAAVNRPHHHGSEKRQTQQISGRVLPHIKSEGNNRLRRIFAILPIAEGRPKKKLHVYFLAATASRINEQPTS